MGAAELALWTYVIALGVLFGGALFEFRVLVHVWSSATPDSVRSWNPNPQYALDPPRRFFVLVTPPLLLLAPLNGWFAWRSTAPSRLWLLGSTAFTAGVIIVTLTYFAPIMLALTERRGDGLTDDVIVRKARTWVRLQPLRLAALALAWLCALQAFRMP